MFELLELLAIPHIALGTAFILSLPWILMIFVCLFQKNKLGYLKKVSFFFIIGMFCANIPFMHVGMIFSYYAYTTNAVILAALVDFKEF